MRNKKALLFTRANALRQQGLSLIELMVGLTIGLLVVLAATSSIIFTRASARTMSDSARLEQQANLIMAMIGQQIKQSGAINLRPWSTTYTCPTNTTTTSGTNVDYSSAVFEPTPIVYNTCYQGVKVAATGAAPAFVNGTEGASGGTDAFTVSYAAPADSNAMNRNCRNELPVMYPPLGTDANGTVVVTAQSPQVVSIFAVRNGSLVCGATAATQDPIAEGIVDMQVRYYRWNTGVTPAVLVAETATNVPDWRQVMGMEVCLHLIGDPVQSPVSNMVDCAGNAIANDGRIHKVARNTFYFRNS